MAILNRFAASPLGRWSEPLISQPPMVALVLKWLAVLVRLYAGFYFILYGYDKLFGGNQVYGMDAEFFRIVGVPAPELTQVLIGALEFFGGLALIAGLLTRLFGVLFFFNMLVATIQVGNSSVELPLLICAVILVITGGGMLSVDQLIDQRLKAQRKM